MDTRNGYYVCKTLRLMNYLCKKFNVKKIIRDKDNNKFVVFLFDDSKEFREYLSGYDEYKKSNN